MKNSDKFLTAFSVIEKQLKTITKSDNRTSFYQLIKNATPKHPVVKHYKEDLKEYADLRNAIVHERSDGHVIAEPNEKAVTQLEKIKNNLIAPPRVYPTFQANVLSFDINKSVGDAVEAMKENSFSQVLILKNGEFESILTANTITRWLGSNIKEDMFILSDNTIGSILKYAENFEKYEFIPKNQSVFETINLINKTEKEGCRLEAALITENGKKSEKIIGILTIADFPKLIKEITR